MLRLEAQAKVLRVRVTSGAGKSATLKIRGKDLNTRLGGRYFHGPPRFRVLQLCAEYQVPGFWIVDHKTMVVTAAELLFLDLTHSFAHPMRLAKIHRRSFDWRDGSSWYERVIGKQIF